MTNKSPDSICLGIIEVRNQRKNMMVPMSDVISLHVVWSREDVICRTDTLQLPSHPQLPCFHST